jgi:Spy/CpxP family protein refolding chaperone
MKNSINKSKIIGLVLLITVFASSDILAQRLQRNLNNDDFRLHQNYNQGRMLNQNLGQGRMNNQNLGQRGFYELDLSVEQQAKVKELRTQNLKQMQPLQNLMQEKRARMRTLTTAENFNQKEVDKLIDEIADLTGKQLKLRTAHQQAFRSMLTEDQRVIFDNSFAKGNRQFSQRNARTGRGVMRSRSRI